VPRSTRVSLPASRLRFSGGGGIHLGLEAWGFGGLLGMRTRWSQDRHHRGGSRVEVSNQARVTWLPPEAVKRRGEGDASI